jgi:protein-L-isoaspartate O-methyltransferase
VHVPVKGFEELYAAHGDPWRFETDGYELGRYATTIEALAHRRYRRAFEPACAIGVLTEGLAELADRVVALDPAPTAVAAARRRLARFTRVSVREGAVPEAWPAGRFDLVVLSELGYYFDETEFDEVIARTRASLDPGGVVVAVHWWGHSDDHLRHGSAVHGQLRRRLGPPAFEVSTIPPGEATSPDPGFELLRWDLR